MEEDFLASLERASWSVALQTFGNSHATLIGLLVEWWVSGASGRIALEGGPSFGKRSDGTRGQCDALLAEGDAIKGVVEVEGTRYESTFKKMGRFFDSRLEPLTHLTFGIFLGYRTGKQGGAIHPLGESEIAHYALQLSEVHPDKKLAVLLLEKKWDPQSTGPRSLSRYYAPRPDSISGMVIESGRICDQRLMTTDV